MISERPWTYARDHYQTNRSVVRRLTVGPTGHVNLPGIRTRNLLITYLFVQRPGIEPGTSAVLKPRHNQLDHLCGPRRRYDEL